MLSAVVAAVGLLEQLQAVQAVPVVVLRLSQRLVLLVDLELLGKVTTVVPTQVTSELTAVVVAVVPEQLAQRAQELPVVRAELVPPLQLQEPQLCMRVAVVAVYSQELLVEALLEQVVLVLVELDLLMLDQALQIQATAVAVPEQLLVQLVLVDLVL
jgi:hypothetical protein